jgi:hypothetical protein
MIRWIVALSLLGLAGLFALAFYERYWRWRGCFNELGRCYDPQSQEVFLEQSGIAWGSLALGCFAAALFLFIRIRRR